MEPQQPQLVTIRTFSQAMEAHIVRSRLEAEGIQSFVADEHTVDANWLYSNAIGGVKLQVHRADVPQVQEVLARQTGGLEPDALVGEGQPSEDQPSVTCPHCGSDQVHYVRYARRALYLSWVLLQFPLPFLRRRWECRECGRHWKVSLPS